MEETASKDTSSITEDTSLLTDLYRLRDSAARQLAGNLESIDSIDPEQTFDIYLSTLRLTHEPKLVQSAYKAALKIENAVSQSEALIDLIEEINYSINVMESDKDINNHQLP